MASRFESELNTGLNLRENNISQIVQYDESLPINFNLVKEGFVDALVSEKFLTAEQGDMIKKIIL